jgi:hypothetical protein
MYYENEISLKKFLSIFKKEKKIFVGQVGVYQDILTLSSYNDGLTPVKFDVYAKVKAIGVYDNLIEIELIDLYSFKTMSDDFKALIEKNMPKYVLSKHVKWNEY